MKVPKFEIPKGWIFIEEFEHIPVGHVRMSKSAQEWKPETGDFSMNGVMVEEDLSCWYFAFDPSDPRSSPIKDSDVKDSPKENPDPTIYSNIIGISAIKLCESMGNDVAANDVRVLRVVLEKYLESERAKGK